MAGELNFKAVFDYGDAKKSVDELYDIFEKGAVKMNEAFSFGRTVDANKKQLRDMISVARQTLTELESVYRSTMDEIKAAGGLQWVTEEERKYVKDLGEGIESTRKLIAGLQENLKEQNFNKNIFAGLTQGLQGLMGAYTAASGVLARFGADEENLVKIQTNLQASMSILMGIQQVYNTLESTSTFRTQVLAKATEWLTAAEMKLAAASGVAKVALGGLVVALAAAVGALAAFASRSEKNKELSKSFTDSVVSGATQQVLAYRKLQAQWEQANGDLEKQRKIVASDDWNKLGISVNNINDAEKILVDRSEAVVRSMIAKAKAAALLAEAQDDIAKAIRNENRAENAENGNYTTGQLIRGAVSALMPGLAGARYTQQGYINGEYVNTEANMPQRKEFATYREYRKAMTKFIAETDAAGYRDLAKKATEDAMEDIRKSSEYDSLADDILRGLGLPQGPGGPTSMNKVAEILEKQQKELARQIVDFEFETRQARINAMAEGTERTLEQINLDFDKEEEAINRWYDDLIDEKIARDRELWNADPKNKGKEFEYNREDYVQTEQETALRDARLAENTATKLKGTQAVFDNYLTFAEKFNKAADGFKGDMDALAEAGAGIETLGVASKQAEEAFSALAEQWIQSGWDEGLVEMTILLTDLEGQLEAIGDTLPEEQTALLRAQIDALREALKATRTETEEDSTSWTDLNTVLTDAAELFGQIGDSFGGEFGSALKMVGQFASSLAKIRVGLKGFKKDGSFAEKFTAGVSIASAALSVVSTVVSKIREAKERTDELHLSTLQYERTLERIRDSAALNGLINAFGSNSYGAFVKNMKIAGSARDALSGALGSLSGSRTWLNYGAGPMLFTNDLVSDMRTGWQKGWGSKKNIFTANWSDFIGEDGNLLGEELKAWYQTYGEGLTEENKELVEGIIAEWERLEDAVNEINGYLGDLFNNVSGSLASKMVQNFIDTGDAIVDMTDYLDDFSRKLAESIVQGKLLDEVFDDAAQASIAKLIAEGDIDGAIAEYEKLLGKANDLAPNINGFLSGVGIKDAAKAQNATVGGFQTMSQDVANELNGRFAALQIAGENILLEARGIHGDTTGIAASAEALQGLALISMGHLEDIATHTKVLPDMAERVINIEKYSKQMVS